MDLLVELNVSTATRGDFEACRTDCLNTICTVLCTPAAGGRGGSVQQVAQAGWQVDQHVSHWLRLQHPVLNLQLDVKVSHVSGEGHSSSTATLHRTLYLAGCVLSVWELP